MTQLTVMETAGNRHVREMTVMSKSAHDKFKAFDEAKQSRLIQMAWEDRTSFDAIQRQFDLTPGEVIIIMRRALQPTSFQLWRKRTAGRTTKHDRRFEQMLGQDKLRRFRARGQRG